ncbi:MAG: rubrerythrin [Candidatus Zixiibacteriota bacterium]|nr:MAG: rubrerythrin [candidate division Zixibacteria bacterium]
MEFDSVDKILDFAIKKEQEAADFYAKLAGNMEHEHMKGIFLSFAAEERGHKAKLIAVKGGKRMLSSEKKVQDLKIGDSLVDVEAKDDLSYQEALIVAMKAEKAAFKLYNDLATATDDANLKSLFLDLAQEEAKHKLRFEIEYDDRILTEN